MPCTHDGVLLKYYCRKRQGGMVSPPVSYRETLFGSPNPRPSSDVSDMLGRGRVPLPLMIISPDLVYHYHHKLGEKTMKPRISLLTLAVDNLERSLCFYRDGLGLATQGIIGQEFEFGAVVFFDLQENLKLALYPRESLAKDSGLALQTANPLEFSIGHIVSSKSEVDEVMLQANNAGATIVKSAQDTFWGGYAGYFQDPDGHLWEIAWNPEWTVSD